MSQIDYKHGRFCNCYDCKDDYVKKLENKLQKPNAVTPWGAIDTDYFSKDFEVQWNTEPIIANPLTALWSDYWSASTWVKWHGLLKAKYGLPRANEVFLIWWNKAPFLSTTTDFRTFDDKFIEYAKANGFYEDLFTGVGGVLGKTAGTGVKLAKAGENVIESVGNAASSIGDTFSFVGSNFKWIIIFVIISVVIYTYLKFKNA